MSELIIFSAINGFSIISGAFLGAFKSLKQRTLAAFMAFGSGTLICALTFGLMEEAFKHGGFDAIIIGFLCGGFLFLAGDYLIHKLGGRNYRQHDPSGAQKENNGLMIALGSVLDGIPESIALGIALFGNRDLGILLLTAIFISNFPEGISSASNLRKGGFSRIKVLSIWIPVGVLMMLITFLSFTFLHGLDPNTIGVIEALAAGAILAMLADSMMPEAYREGGYAIGALTVLGFLLAFIVSRL